MLCYAVKYISRLVQLWYLTSFSQAEWWVGPDEGRVFCDRGRVYSSVTEVEFNQRLLEFGRGRISVFKETSWVRVLRL